MVTVVPSALFHCSSKKIHASSERVTVFGNRHISTMKSRHLTHHDTVKLAIPERDVISNHFQQDKAQKRHTKKETILQDMFKTFLNIRTTCAPELAGAKKTKKNDGTSQPVSPRLSPSVVSCLCDNKSHICDGECMRASRGGERRLSALTRDD